MKAEIPKRILICQNSLVNIAGSEIVTLELAEYFQDQGAEVTIYTIYQDSPMNELFNNFNVLLPDEFNLKVDDFDLIWVHQHILPESIIRSMGNEKVTATEFIFFHMSAFLDFEMPYMYDLENKLSSISLWVSEETKQANQKYLENEVITNGLLFQNPAPETFWQNRTSALKTPPEKVVLVTNHPCEELAAAIETLEEQGIEVIKIGSKFKPSRITYEALKDADAIISIGKTVQYGLAMGIPVYVYDHFGGPGFLNSDNFDLAEWHNFSGRGFNKKTSDEIAQEIINGHAEAWSYVAENADVIAERFRLETQISRLLGNLRIPVNEIDLNERYIEYLSLGQRMIVDYVTRIHTYNHIVDYLDGMSAELGNCKEVNARLTSQVEEYKNRKVIKLIDKVHKLLRGKLGLKET